MLNYHDIEDVEFSDIHSWDAPDFVDAYISSARFKSTGKALTDSQLDELNDDEDAKYDFLMAHLY